MTDHTSAFQFERGQVSLRLRPSLTCPIRSPPATHFPILLIHSHAIYTPSPPHLHPTSPNPDGLPSDARDARVEESPARGRPRQLPPAQGAADGGRVRPLAQGHPRRSRRLRKGRARDDGPRTSPRKGLLAPDQRRVCLRLLCARCAARGEIGRRWTHVRAEAIGTWRRSHPPPPPASRVREQQALRLGAARGSQESRRSHRS